MRFVWSGVMSNIKTANIHSMLKKMITIGVMDARLFCGHCQICHPHSQNGRMDGGTISMPKPTHGKSAVTNADMKEVCSRQGRHIQGSAKTAEAI